MPTRKTGSSLSEHTLWYQHRFEAISCLTKFAAEVSTLWVTCNHLALDTGHCLSISLYSVFMTDAKWDFPFHCFSLPEEPTKAFVSIWLSFWSGKTCFALVYFRLKPVRRRANWPEGINSLCNLSWAPIQPSFRNQKNRTSLPPLHTPPFFGWLSRQAGFCALKAGVIHCMLHHDAYMDR